MSKLTGKLRNAVTKVASQAYSQEEIIRQSMEGTHNSESMQQIFKRIMSDPNLEHRETKPGVYDLVYNKDGKEDIIGWYDCNRMMGEISQKGYDRLEIPRTEVPVYDMEISDREMPEIGADLPGYKTDDIDFFVGK